MKDLRIVIVSWNVETLLERCLASLPAACGDLSWDVVVVDNASQDASAAVASTARNEILRQTQDDRKMMVIANADNRGFAKATNQGIVGQDARYVLLLNPDTECPPNSLRDFVREADTHPKAGIFGPRLIYPDGSPQPSVRRFPTVWSQLGILLKLHHLAPWLPTFRRYFSEKIVDQVMGACFLIRREVIDQIGGLDERYFIWFEEVDYCKQAIGKGWKVCFVPDVTVIHHGGQSFAQVMTTAKQRMFNRSLLAYFEKWHPGWRAWLLRLLSPVSIFLSWLHQSRSSFFGRLMPWIATLAAADVLSYWTVFLPWQRAAMTIAIGGLVFLVSLLRPRIGLAVLFLELVVGSKGALFKIPNGWEVDGGTSLRIVIFAAFILGWLVSCIRLRETGVPRRILGLLRGRFAWSALIILVGYAAVRGMVINPQTWLSDANAWAFILLLFPVLDIASREREQFVRTVREATIAGLIWLPFKTVLLLYVWSHGIPSLSQPLYLWIRRTGVGEVTLVTGNLFRVFIQSQVYAIGGFFAALAYLVEGKSSVIARSESDERRGNLVEGLLRRMTSRNDEIWFAVVVLIGSVVSLAISLSRSFWIGCFGGGVAFLFLLFLRPPSGERGPVSPVMRNIIDAGSAIKRALGPAIVAVGLAAALLAGTVFFPFPRVDTGSLATLFGSRGSVSDAAAESRWSLLPVLVDTIWKAPILGSGFGAAVTYQSKDPRILAQNPDGWYTTYTFEWGWLEHWIKFGILGIPVMIWLVISLIVRVWKTETPWWQRAGFVSTLVSLAVLHVFTPYLNHPLGFGMLLMAEGWLAARRVSRAV